MAIRFRQKRLQGKFTMQGEVLLGHRNLLMEQRLILKVDHQDMRYQKDG